MVPDDDDDDDEEEADSGLLSFLNILFSFSESFFNATSARLRFFCAAASDLFSGMLVLFPCEKSFLFSSSSGAALLWLLLLLL